MTRSSFKQRWAWLCPGIILVGVLTSTAQTSNPTPVWYNGLRDASAVVALDQRYFAVADDEDNVLRVFDRQQPGRAIFSWDSSGFLRVDPRSPESDLEGAARIGDRIYWITSHGRSKEAEYRESRHRLFATIVNDSSSGHFLYPTGAPYLNLNEDLLRDPRLKPFGLSLAATRAPKSEDAFNIEGLAATPDGKLLIGFRNPVPNGKALLVPLLNPAGVVSGQRAQLGDPILLDLQGRAIRSIAWVGDRYLIIAGSYNATSSFALFDWAGHGPARKINDLNLPGLTPEGIDLIPGVSPETLLIVSDDGSVKKGKNAIKGGPGKKGRKMDKRLRAELANRFRVVELVLSR